MRFSISSAVIVATVALAAPAIAAPSTGDAARGTKLFKQRCGLCHAVAPEGAGKPGPNLKGVVNRKAGKEPAFAYSPSMKKANFTWTTKTLDPYLAAPAKLVPGTFMMTAVQNPAERADIIAYLQTVK